MLIISAKKFTWCHGCSNGIASTGCMEISDLPRTFAPSDQIAVIGKKSTKIFTFVNVLRDSENDVLGWRYMSTCRRFELCINND